MTHGHTRIPPKGVCIYCGARDVTLTDEHVVPLSLGGFHILEKASCSACAKITAKFEQDVARELWGHARIAYGAPSRRKKKRPTHILLSDPKNPTQKVRVPYSEYAPGMVFYKMHQAGMLAGTPEDFDTSSGWMLVAIANDEKLKTFEKKFGIPMTFATRHVPDSFARLLAKVAYCHVLTELELSDFQPCCVPYILGAKSNLSYIVGGEFEIPPPNSRLGYILNTLLEGTMERMKLIASVRLFASEHTPRYHVVVGEIVGRDNIVSVMRKYEFPEKGLLTAVPDRRHYPAHLRTSA
jgi:HNH endonuclease